MTTARRFGDHYYLDRYSPPVSPRSQPHGHKRKASTQDDDHDELVNQSLISNTFKKLRLNNVRGPSAARGDSTAYLIDHDDVRTPESIPSHPSHTVYKPSPARHLEQDEEEEDDFMPIDDTADRVWVHDLDAEIAEIEAEEERQNSALQLTEAGKEASKIPEYVLKQSSKTAEPSSNMQMVLYRDPISISVPEEDDAVRKTVIEARKRVREKQAEERNDQQLLPSDISVPVDYMLNHEDNDDMEID